MELPTINENGISSMVEAVKTAVDNPLIAAAAGGVAGVALGIAVTSAVKSKKRSSKRVYKKKSNKKNSKCEITATEIRLKHNWRNLISAFPAY